MISQSQHLSAASNDHDQSVGTSAGIESLLAAFAAMADDIDLDTVLKRVISAACQLVDARYGALGVIGPGQTLSQFITVGLEDDEIRMIGALPQGHGVLGLLVKEPQPLRLHNLRDHDRAVGFPEHHPQMTSFVGVPIRIHGTVFGNLYLTEKNGGADFTDTDEQLLVALAAAAGVAIENSRLFDESTNRRVGRGGWRVVSTPRGNSSSRRMRNATIWNSSHITPCMPRTATSPSCCATSVISAA